MKSAEFWAQDNPRVDVLNDGELQSDRGCVLLWVQRAQRAQANQAVNLAVEIAKDLNLPVIAAFCLVPAFPSANLRHYHFMAEGLRELPEAFATRGIGWTLAVGEPVDVIPKLAREHHAVAILTDLNPLRIGREWRSQVAAKLDIPMLVVDSDTVVPSSLFLKSEYAPRTLRPKIHAVLNQYLQRVSDIKPLVVSDLRIGPDPLVAIASFDLDTSVGPAPDLRGGAKEARIRLQHFVSKRLDVYDTQRNRADIDAGTVLSPYQHYGQIGPIEIALAVQESDAPDVAKESLLDELIVQRELSINYALRNTDYDRYAGIPNWGRETLAKHADDKRDSTYTLGQLERAATHDALWNAAMTQMIHEGWLPNRLRMYWGKQILLWSETPELAYRHTVHLNDKYFIDGRDANSYANIGWSIGGLHDRPFGPERKITGLVRPMGIGAMKRSFDIGAYTEKTMTRWGTSQSGLDLE
jgi:deoxyribodipyrimidine photo-lyase